MAKKVAHVDYQRCHPESCDHGECLAALECEYGYLAAEGAYEAPEVNPVRWCHGCAKCASACPMKAIRML